MGTTNEISSKTGLFLAKNAADAIGAKITLKNRTDREGTVASLVIPHKI